MYHTIVTREQFNMLLLMTLSIMCIKYILQFNHNIKVAIGSFENVAQFKYFGMTVTSQNLIQEEIKRRLNLGNAFYHSA
jgi:hypothetical protein